MAFFVPLLTLSIILPLWLSSCSFFFSSFSDLCFPREHSSAASQQDLHLFRKDRLLNCSPLFVLLKFQGQVCVSRFLCYWTIIVQVLELQILKNSKVPSDPVIRLNRLQMTLLFTRYILIPFTKPFLKSLVYIN